MNISSGGAPRSIISPALLLEQLELGEIEQELEKLPLLDAPHTR